MTSIASSIASFAKEHSLLVGAAATAVLGLATWQLSKPKRREILPGDSVFITGCSSGIGKHAALFLNEKGFRVFATVRQADAGAELKAEAKRPEEMFPILMDTTKQSEVDAAVEFVRARVKGGLCGLFNNAGGSVHTPDLSVEGIPMQIWEQVIQTNFFGHLRVTKAFLPLLREYKRGATIIFNSSIAGRIAFPYKGPYSCAKFAMEALGDTLRRETRKFGLRVVVMEPGFIESGTMKKHAKKRQEISDVKQPENELYPEQRKMFTQFAAEAVRTVKPATVTSEWVLRILLCGKPKPRYMIGGGAGKMKQVARLPDSTIDWLIFRQLDTPGSQRIV